MKSPRLGLWLCCRRCSAMRWHTASLQRVLSTEPPRKSEVKPGWVLQILFYAKLCFNKVILIPKWNKVFLSFSLEVLHHYWLLVPRKLDFSPVAFEFIDWEEAWVGFFLPLVFSSLPFPWVGEVSISVWQGEDELFQSLYTELSALWVHIAGFTGDSTGYNIVWCFWIFATGAVYFSFFSHVVVQTSLLQSEKFRLLAVS